MNQNKQLKIRLAACAVIALLVSSLSASVHAVDDDYYIPYTDNYGYTYDPKTGTFVKQDSPAPNTTTSTVPSATTTTPADTGIQTAAGDPMQSEVQAETGSATGLTGKNIMLAGLLLLAVVTGSWLVSRKKAQV